MGGSEAPLAFTLIALVEFTAGNKGLVQDGKEACAHRLFGEAFLHRR
jgi:hypothetical protein